MELEYRHEIISFGDSVPVRCFIHQLGYSGRHWHNSLELLFVMSGSVTIFVDGERYVLQQDDVILVNSNAPHELKADQCILAAVQIKLSLFDKKLLPESDLYFDCNSQTRPNDPGIVQIKRIVAQFIKNYSAAGESRLFRAKSLSYELLSALIGSFRIERSERDQAQSHYHYERITRIVSYINEHYNENLSLQALAEQEFLSGPYLSKFFMRMMGVNFSAYVNQLRLSHAVTDLTTTTLTIEANAERNGFSNTQAFVQLFKKKYDMLPSLYRKRNAGAEVAPAAPASFNDYKILDTHQYLSYFAAYLSDDGRREQETSALPCIVSHYTANALAKGTPLRHTWRSFTSVGNIKDVLLTDVREMLAELQRDVGFRYIKFHGILSDDMHVCFRESSGALRFSFVYVDKALDVLREMRLKPLIQLSFMPAALAEDPEHTIFASRMINSPPWRMEEWCALVEALVRHLIGRYGAQEVESWPFTVWNEPDTPENMFGFPSEEMFYAFYDATVETLRAVDPRLRVGTPSTYFDSGDSGTWIRRFTAHCHQRGTMPDFVLFHYYGTGVTYEEVKSMGGTISRQQLRLVTDENMMKKSIDMILSFVRADYPAGTPVYLTEWNFSPSHRDLLGDTCFRSCYLVKNILENYDRLDSMGYWLLTDLFEEQQVPQETFHGGLGMFTYNGIRKPVYYALRLLAKLGDTLISSGDGYFLTRRGENYQLMLYHYRHYSDLYAAGEIFDMTFTDRYTPFAPEQKRDFELRIEGLAEGEWHIREYTLNRQSGSCFDKWVEMGAQPLESGEEIELLKGLSQPMLTRYTLQAQRGRLMVNAMLDPLEVRLILLEK